MSDLTPKALAELQRLLDECQPGRVIVNDLRPTHHAIWLDSRYDSGEWESLRTLAEIDTETETLEVLWGLNDAVLIAAALNALPDLLNAAAERDALGAAVERVRALHSPWCHKHSGPWGPGHTDPSCFEYCFECAQDGPCPTILALDATPTGGGA